jgi:hypothetical protein
LPTAAGGRIVRAMKVRHAKEKAQVPAPPTMPGRHVVEATVHLPGAPVEPAVAAQVGGPNAPAAAQQSDRDDRISPDYFLG